MTAQRHRPDPLARAALLLAGAAMLLAGAAVLLARLPTGTFCAPAGAEETSPESAQAAALSREYEGLVKYTDFGSFSKRMAALRALGRLGSPAGQATLLEIVGSSKRLDDEVVALMSMGPALNLATARALASFVERRGGQVRVHALAVCFGEASDPAVLTWLADEGLQSKSRDVRQAVLDAQAFHADPRALPALVEVFGEQSEKRAGMDLAYAAVRGLGAIGAQGGEAAGPVRRFLLRAVGNADFRVRLAAAEVIARQVPMDLNLRGALRQLLTDDVPVVRQAAARSIGQAKLEELIPDLAGRLNDARTKTRSVAHAALVASTGKDLGYDPDAWRTWFEHRTINPTMKKDAPSTSVVSYYGVRVDSDRVLFIVDLSGSMGFPWGQDTTRIDVARAELKKVLKGLAPDTLFNIIVFSDKVKAWRKGEVLATPDAVERALLWTEKAFEKPGGSTFMHSALEQAFAENTEVDTIFLLTDGLATDGEPIVPEAILASVSAWNRYRGVTINTFALTLENLDRKGLNDRALDDIKQFMRQLALLTRGTATVIDDLPADLEQTPADPHEGKK